MNFWNFKNNVKDKFVIVFEHVRLKSTWFKRVTCQIIKLQVFIDLITFQYDETKILNLLCLLTLTDWMTVEYVAV